MQSTRTIEISVDSLAKALAAERGGAHRIELCSDLSQGGLTPDAELLRSVRELVRLPIFAMIRPRGGDFVYSDTEYAEVQREIETARRLGADGLVFGLLQRDGQVDVRRTQRLVEVARPLPVTFHRAIDVSADIYKALEDVMQTGAVRVLTSGGAATAPEGAASLAKLVQAASGRIIVMPGCGITASNVTQVAKSTAAREFHAGLSSVSLEDNAEEKRFEEEVRRLAEALALIPSIDFRTSETDSELER
ncbi:MAG: copper homeostasis protein CutC [Candidatus Acidiferrum sp.]|jgi:copper homeostasis protein